MEFSSKQDPQLRECCTDQQRCSKCIKGKGRARELELEEGEMKCWHCQAVKVSCSGEYPCEECSARGIKCSYPRAAANAQDWTTLSPTVEYFAAMSRLSLGALGSARLHFTGGSFEWQGAVEQREDLRMRQDPRYLTTLIFPATTIDNSRKQTLEAGIDTDNDHELLRHATNLLPTTPLPTTLLLNSILQSRSSKRVYMNHISRPNSSLHLGNCLASLGVESASSENSAFVAWRSGNQEDGTSTCVGIGVYNGRTSQSFDQSNNAHNIIAPFRPVAPIFANLVAPILQLQLAPLPSVGHGLLAIRTHTSVSLLQLDLSDPDSIEPPPIVSVFEYFGRDLKNRCLVDVSIGGLNGGGERGSGLLIDDQGGLFGWGIGSRGTGRIGHQEWNRKTPEMFELRRARKRDKDYSGFARVEFTGARGLDAMVGFDDEVLVYDLRSPTSSLTLVDERVLDFDIDIIYARPLVTSLTMPSSNTTLSSRLSATTTPSPFHAICTTHDVVWIDERMPGKDVMRWGHARKGESGTGVDTTLTLTRGADISDEADGDVSRVVLHSQLSGLSTCYTYANSISTPVASLLDPYSVSSTVPAPNQSRPNGLTILPASIPVSKGEDNESVAGWLIMMAGVEGDLYSRFMTLEEIKLGPTFDNGDRRIWDDAVKQLARSRKSLVDPDDYVAKQEVVERVDLTRVYEECIRIKQPENKDDKDDEPKVESPQAGMEETLDGMIGTMKEIESDDDRFLTAIDIATLWGANKDGPPEENDLAPPPTVFDSQLASTILGFSMSAAQEPIQRAVDSIAATSASSINLFPSDSPRSINFRQHLAPDLVTDLKEMQEHSTQMKKSYGLSSIGPLTYAQQVVADACDQVVIDLALSSRVYSKHTFVDQPAPPQGITINTPWPPGQDPPLMHFSYLQPERAGVARPEDIAENDEDEASDGEEEVQVTAKGRRVKKRKKRKPLSLLSTAARALAFEWQLGTKVADYVWINPYEEEHKVKTVEAPADTRGRSSRKRSRHDLSDYHPSSPLASSSQHPMNRRLTTLQESFTPRPPTFAPSSPLQYSASQPAFGSAFLGSSQSQSQSQAFGGGSQTLAGVFGGGEREKKKLKKKRTSGF